MTSSKVKGQKKETLCANELKEQGYFIAFKSCNVKRGPCWVGLDFADLFDVVALDQMRWRFISCKHASRGHAQHRQEIDAFRCKFGISEGMSFEVWDWHKGKGWVKWYCNGGPIDGWTRDDQRGVKPCKPSSSA